MAFDEVRSVVAKLESDIASGPIVPTVTPHEIRGYLASRYDFRTPRALDEVGADVERMLRTWQGEGTPPRYFGRVNPSVTLAAIIGGPPGAVDKPQPANWRPSPPAHRDGGPPVAGVGGEVRVPGRARPHSA